MELRIIKTYMALCRKGACDKAGGEVAPRRSDDEQACLRGDRNLVDENFPNFIITTIKVQPS